MRRMLQRHRRRRASRTLAWVFLALLAAFPISAVVIDTGNGTGNTSAPPDDFGFAYVGATGSGLSGVYLGNGWVLTANHVGAVAITLQGQTYPPVVGSGVRLQNSSGAAPDLYVYRLDDYPALPPLALSNATPTVGEDVVCLGNGWNREAASTSWNANWEEAMPPPAFQGFKRGVGRTRRWGRNEVSANGIDVEILNGSGVTVSSTRSVESLFDHPGGLADEMQAVKGDSGGGCFAKRGGSWQLVGLMFAISTFADPNGEPLPPPAQPANTAVYGNGTFAADVFFYRTQIEQLTPPPVPALGPSAVGVLGTLFALAAGRLAHRARTPRAPARATAGYDPPSSTRR